MKKNKIVLSIIIPFKRHNQDLIECLNHIQELTFPYNEVILLPDADYALPHKFKVGAVGGPAITPQDDPFCARVSGAIFLSKFSGGFPERYRPIPPIKK